MTEFDLRCGERDSLASEPARSVLRSWRC